MLERLPLGFSARWLGFLGVEGSAAVALGFEFPEASVHHGGGKGFWLSDTPDILNAVRPTSWCFFVGKVIGAGMLSVRRGFLG